MDNNNQTHAIDKTKSNIISAPNILAGMLPLVFIMLSAFLSLSWYIINYQVEKLVAKRTSEYAHSIVKIAADSSAEALLSEDNLQLELLTQNIAKDRYIHTATIYSSDGIVVSQYPQEITIGLSAADQNNNRTLDEIAQNNSNNLKSDSVVIILSTNDKEISKESSKKITYEYFLAKKNIPFLEKIAFKGVTAGWFKIEIDGLQLESDFRENFHRIKVRVFALATFLIFSLLYLLLRYKRKVDRLVCAIHLLVRRKAIKSDVEVIDSQKIWFQQVDNLAEASFSNPIHLRELRQHVRWQGEEVLESVPLIWLAIDLPKQDNQNLVQQVVTIESYVKSATNAYSTFFQGEIFSGGIVPFLQHATSETNLSKSSHIDLVSFIYLLKALLNSLDANIKLKAVLFSSRINSLHSDDSMQNRVILPQRKTLKISKLTNLLSESSFCCLANDPSIYDDIAEYEAFVHKHKNITNAFLLKEASHDIINHVARISSTIIKSDIRN